MARQTMREKFEELDREKSQRRLVNAAGGVAIGAAGCASPRSRRAA